MDGGTEGMAGGQVSPSFPGDGGDDEGPEAPF
jgi:hypothetical protein